MLALHVVDAAAIGVPVETWQGYTVAERTAITHEHNARIKRK